MDLVDVAGRECYLRDILNWIPNNRFMKLQPRRRVSWILGVSFIISLQAGRLSAVTERDDVAEAFRTMQTHQQVQEALREVEGRIQRIKSVQLLGTDTHHLVILLKTSRGEHELISDLGPLKELRRYHLNLGDPIRILGKVSAVDGQPILIAEKLRIRDQVHRVRRQSQTDLAERIRFRRNTDTREARE